MARLGLQEPALSLGAAPAGHLAASVARGPAAGAAARAELWGCSHPGKKADAAGTAVQPHRSFQPCCLRPPALLQAAWRGWRVRRLLARARQALLQQSQNARQGQRSSSDSLELEQSGSLLGLGALLEAGASEVFGAPEELLSNLEAWSPVCGAHCSSPPEALERQACSGTSQQALRAQQGEEQSDWEFADAATAAAFASMRQRRQAGARRRELQQQMRDPQRRLHKFQTLHSVEAGTSRSRPAKSGGSRCGGSTDHTELSLPPLRKPKAGGCTVDGSCGTGFAAAGGGSSWPAASLDAATGGGRGRGSGRAVLPRLMALPLDQ